MIRQKIKNQADFLHALKKASLGMLNSAQEKEIFNNSLKIRVLRPKDIIRLKLQAIKNDLKRLQKYLTDIESLLNIYGHGLDRLLLEKYFQLFDMQDLYEKLIGEKNK